ncbi:hypothetical protein T265_15836, partial [Opisthorchis viverrini]
RNPFVNFQPAIKELEKVLGYLKGVSALLDELEKFIKNVPGPESTKSIKTTINSMRQVLREATGLNDKIMELINAFKALQDITHLLQAIQQFGRTLKEVV